MRPVLVTSGATRNPVDAMRVLSARSGGGTGSRVAAALLAAGARVRVLGSPEALLRAPPGAEREEFGSTRDLLARMERWVRANPSGVVVHAAAVGDYEVAEPEAGKIPSGREELVLRLRPAPKIAPLLRGWGPGIFLATFKAAPPGTAEPALELVARRQLEATASDVVFANVLGRLGGPVLLVERGGTRRFERRADGLDALARRLLRACAAVAPPR